MVNVCNCHNLPAVTACDCGCESTNALAIMDYSESSKKKENPKLSTKTFVPGNCVTTLTQTQLAKLIEESVKNKKRTVSLLIHQLNEVRRELTLESNDKIEAKFHLDRANYELNRIESTPVGEVILLEMENCKLKQTNRLLLKQFDQMKKVLSK